MNTKRVWKPIIALLAVALILSALTVGGASIVYALAHPRLRSQLEAVPQQLVVKLEVNPDRGLVVVALDKEGPAAAAGIVRGDIILAVNDTPVNTLDDLKTILTEVQPGDVLDVLVLHGDDERTVRVQVGEQNGAPFLGVTLFASPTGMGRIVVGSGNDQLIPGATVVEVREGSPAAQAGLQRGDHILSVDGVPVDADKTLADLIAEHQPGDSITLKVERIQGGVEDIKVQLGENPEKPGAAYLGIRYAPGLSLARPEFKGDALPKLPENVLPFAPYPFPFNLPVHPGPNPKENDLGKKLEVSTVIKGIVADSPAAKAGLRAGDKILAIDDKPVKSPREFVVALGKHQPGDVIHLRVQGPGDARARDVEIRLGEHPSKPGVGYLGVELGIFVPVELPLKRDENQSPPGFNFHLPFGDDNDSDQDRPFKQDQGFFFGLPFDRIPFGNREKLPFDPESLEPYFEFQTPGGGSAGGHSF